MISTVAKITLLFVVFVDLIGQGLVFPIINGLIMMPGAGFLPEDAPAARRHLDYGLVIGSFFIAWFLGVIYIARVSDAIGRRNALLICLAGAMVGYAVTIVSVLTNNLWLMVLGRAITGFTAGNQPIAQAAMIDGSGSDAERDRNMGLLLIGVSAGVVGGPIIGGLLSDKALLGGVASNTLPLYAAMGLVALAMVLVFSSYHDIRTERPPFVFRARDIIDNLWEVRRHPVVLRLMPVYVAFMIANTSFYIFVDNYLASRFDYGIIGGSVAMMVIGAAVAISGAFLVGPAQARYDKRVIVAVTFVVWIAAALGFVAAGSGPLALVAPFCFYLVFGVSYPLILGAFSAAVGPEDQGWIMGVTTAVFCLSGGINSFLGGALMGIDIRLPFYLTAAMALLGLALLRAWRRPEIRVLTAVPEG